jgi:hypothetical protein
MDEVIRQINDAREDVVAAGLFDPWSEIVVLMGGRDAN